MENNRTPGVMQSATQPRRRGNVLRARSGSRDASMTSVSLRVDSPAGPLRKTRT